MSCLQTLRRSIPRWLAIASMCFPLVEAGAAPPQGKRPREPKAVPGAETKSIEELTASCLKSLAVITHFSRDGKEDGVGAGVILSADGLIGTSLHVIGEARPIGVQLADGKRYPVTEVHAWDRKSDLAILRIEAKGLRALKLGDSDLLKQGAPVIVLGNPLGWERSVVQGVVSARREIEGVEMFQVAIPVEPGFSGGPLLDLKGRVQGIITLKSAITANLGFAVPGNLLQALLDKPNPIPMSRWLTLGALNTNDWAAIFGARWHQKGGRILVDGVGAGFGGRSLCLSQKPVPPRPYEVAVNVRLKDEAGAAGLVFGSDGEHQHYGFYPTGGQLRLTRFEGPDVYSWTILKQIASEHYHRNEWNHLRVRVEPGRIRCYLNGLLVVESEDSVLGDGKVGLAKFRDTEAEFKGFQVDTNLAPAAGAPVGAAFAQLPAELARQIEQARGTADAGLVEQLQKQGAAGQEALKDRAQDLEQEAGRLRRLAASVHQRSVLGQLVQALEGAEEKIDLFHAALLVAKLDQAELEVDSYRQQVAEMAREVSGRFPAGAGDEARLTALVSYLFAESGFHGSRHDYYNRANSHINEVLDDREGIPITLSILFLELAQRLGLSRVSGLPLPGHFMVRFVPAQGEDWIIDVFNGGRRLTRTEAQEQIIEATGKGFRDEDYQVAAKRQIILRMLRNLIDSVDRDGSSVDALRYLDAILALSPDSARDRLNRARLRLQATDTVGAKEDFRWLLDHRPEGIDLERIEEVLRSL